jgi:uncharacterized protein YmfQ (DUF2313 family)
MRSPAQAQAELLALSPGGWAWNPDPQGIWGTMLLPLAAEISRVEAAAEAMLPESAPLTSVNLLPDYERVLGPDPCAAAPTLLADRQRLAHRRWVATGGQSIAYFVGLAAAQGIAVTITEHPVFQAGASVCNGASCGASPSQFYWTVNLPLSRTVLSVCAGAACGGASCGAFEGSGLECPIGREAPAHTQVIFNYL